MHATAVLLGAASGLTIFLGLPVSRTRRFPRSIRSVMPAVATGVLIFLLWDVLQHAGQVVEESMNTRGSRGALTFAALLAVFLGGFAVGLLALVYSSGRLLLMVSPAAPPSRQIALMIATGLGLHNLSEGLAIGQGIASGGVALTGILVIGFGLHNITEGFGIGAPLATDERPPSWQFLGLAGLIGGGPTALGAGIGSLMTSPFLYVLFLTLAAGAIVYVINEMFPLGKRISARPAMAWGLLLGFTGAYLTDLLLTYAGA